MADDKPAAPDKPKPVPIVVGWFVERIKGAVCRDTLVNRIKSSTGGGAG
jgi:hypothetical protein